MTRNDIIKMARAEMLLRGLKVAAKRKTPNA